MASPRNQFRYDEIDPKQRIPVSIGTGITYSEGARFHTTQADLPVKFNGTSGEIVPAAADDQFVGVLELIMPDKKTATIQTQGIRLLKCASGATFTLNQSVVADGSGGVKAAGTGVVSAAKAWFKPTSTTVYVRL